MNILAFDTCLDKMYVALLKGDENISSKIIETTKEHYHSAFLISTITNILKEHMLEPKNIDVVVTNIGPGSFTGIRACTTVARAFAQGLDKSALGISSLEILAKINDTKKPSLVVLDARKNMGYVAIYKDTECVLSPCVMLLDEVENMVKTGDYFLITDDKLQPLLGGVSYQSLQIDLGKVLLEISKDKLNHNVDTEWSKLLPLYIQPPPVS